MGEDEQKPSPPKGEEKPKEASQSAASFMTTEHFTLQTGRASTISESNGRASLFLVTVSSALVALGFIGQSSEMGQPFLVFALILLPSLLALGAFTFVRVLETALEDMLYLLAMSRIRHYFVEQSPELRRYLVMSIHDDVESASASTSTVKFSIPGLQILLTSAGMISMINSVIGGVFSAIVAGLFGITAPLTLVIIGFIVFGLMFFVQTRYQQTAWKRAVDDYKPLFPAPNVDKAQAIPER